MESLLSKYNVVNYRIEENAFHKNACIEKPFPVDPLEDIRNLLRLEANKQKEAIILYTSGTSGPPKGVVITRLNILRFVETLIQVWEITPNDHLLHVLPLNHVHGLIYCLLSYLFAGAQTHMLPKFNPEIVWRKLLDSNNEINSFMAVPTIYVQLVDFYAKNEAFRKEFDHEKVRYNYRCLNLKNFHAYFILIFDFREIFKKKIRLVASGSASLTVKTSEEWERITGYRILERYGSTEVGLGLSNPYRETASRKRLAGAVGRPYGNTTVRIVEPHENGNSDSKHVLIESTPETDKIVRLGQDNRYFGELQIKGDMVFREYLNKPQQTKETFSEDGWFKTGDTVEYLPDSKAYRIIGRTSVDVIKSGGYKISALDVERAILSNDMIEEVCVMGLADQVLGDFFRSLCLIKFFKQFFRRYGVNVCLPCSCSNRMLTFLKKHSLNGARPVCQSTVYRLLSN